MPMPAGRGKPPGGRQLRAALRHLPPYPVLLAAGGLCLGLIPDLPSIHLQGQLILTVFVPALVFEAAANVNLRELRQQALRVGSLATLGVLVTIVVVATLSQALAGLTWLDGFLLGANLAPTDPIAVTAVLRRLPAPPALGAVLEGESLFNDGTGVVAFAVVMAALQTAHISLPDLAAQALELTIGGAAVGVLVGTAAAGVLRLVDTRVSELTTTLVAAYAAYVGGQWLGVSGVMATVVAGVVVGSRENWRERTARNWQRLAVALNVVLFALIGLGLPSYHALLLLPAVAVTYLAVLAARSFLVFSAFARTPFSWRPVGFLGGLRGALSVALALVARDTAGVDGRVPTIAYGVVVAGLLLQGALLRPLLRLSGVATKPPPQEPEPD